MERISKVKLFIFLISILFIAPLFVNAATLYLEPGEGTYGPGDSISADIKIDIGEQCVNTVEAELLFPREFLNIADFLIGDSIINLWVDRPDEASIKQADSTGSLHLAGGIPGGYCGRIPGDPGLSNIVGRVIFVIPSLIVSEVKPDTSKIDFSSATRVLLNDGLGTEDRLATKGAEFGFAASRVSPGSRWQDQYQADDIPPEPFVIELQANPDMFEGRYYVIFSTLDKQSGLDRYEILEIRPGEQIGVKPEEDFLNRWLGTERAAPVWRRAAIPYPLLDQDLKSIIRVRAVDKAGNERIVEYIPPGVGTNQTAEPAPARFSSALVALAAFTLIIIAAIFIFMLIRIKRTRKKIYGEENKSNGR